MLKSKRLRIIIDTNLWISFLISGRYKKLDQLFFQNQLVLLFSIELLNEIDITVSKPKLKKYFKEQALEEMLSAFESYIDLVTVKSEIQVCRDKKDNFLLALAKDGKADYLLSGDQDLLTLNKFSKTRITTIADFISKFL
jgi:hypothetical protein